MSEWDQNESGQQESLRRRAEVNYQQTNRVKTRAGNTATWRPAGEGSPISRTGGKETMGRTFITTRHEGQLARNTEFLAGKRLGRGEPTTEEIAEALQEHKYTLDPFRKDSHGKMRTPKELYSVLREMGLA